MSKKLSVISTPQGTQGDKLDHQCNVTLSTNMESMVLVGSIICETTPAVLLRTITLGFVTNYAIARGHEPQQHF